MVSSQGERGGQESADILVNGEEYIWCEQHGKLEPRVQEREEQRKREIQIPTNIWPW